MPTSTAQWLIENTKLTFEQIANFCGLHELEVTAIANAETRKMQGLNPILNGQLTRDEILRCESDPAARLELNDSAIAAQKSQPNKSRYIPLIHRQNRIGGILWLLKNYPELSDTQIAKLLRSTKKTVEALRNKTHSSLGSATIQNPIVLGLTTEGSVQEAVAKAKKKSDSKKEVVAE